MNLEKSDASVDDPWQGYSASLASSELIAVPGYGKGFPVFAGWGKSVAECLIRLFQEEFSRGYLLNIHVPSTLINAAQYDSEVAAFGGYDNIYRLKLRGQELVVRPDAAVENLRVAMQAKGNKSDSSVLSVFQGFRRIKGMTLPLFRDRCIWPFLQLDRVVSSGRRQQAIEDILSALNRIFARLCLSARTISLGSWKDYARTLFDVVLFTPTRPPTIGAMFFEVGESYRQAAGIPDDYDSFDVGFTEKVLSLIVISQLGEAGFALPSSVAPIQVVVGSDMGQLPNNLESCKLRIQVVPIAGEKWWKKWQLRGVPLVVEHVAGRTRYKLSLGQWSAWEPSACVEHLLLNNDCLLAARGRQRIESSIRDHSAFYCDQCTPAGSWTGELVPTVEDGCQSCSQRTTLKFISRTGQIY